MAGAAEQEKTPRRLADGVYRALKTEAENTRENVCARMAVVINDKVILHHKIREAIPGWWGRSPACTAFGIVDGEEGVSAWRGLPRFVLADSRFRYFLAIAKVEGGTPSSRSVTLQRKPG